MQPYTYIYIGPADLDRDRNYLRRCRVQGLTQAGRQEFVAGCTGGLWRRVRLWRLGPFFLVSSHMGPFVALHLSPSCSSVFAAFLFRAASEALPASRLHSHEAGSERPVARSGELQQKLLWTNLQENTVPANSAFVLLFDSSLRRRMPFRGCGSASAALFLLLCVS